MEQLTEVLDGMKIPEGTKLTLSLFPEVLFGFQPPHLDKMLERLDCPSCSQVARVAGATQRAMEARAKRVEEEARPIKERNAAKLRTHKARRRIPLIGRFFNSPELETVPDCAHEPWCIEATRSIELLERLFQTLQAQDAPHWGTEAEKAISHELILRYLQREHIHVG